MPELPEVEAARRFVERLCSGTSVIAVSTQEAGGGPREGLFDEIVYEVIKNTTPNESERSYSSALLGKTLKHVHRKGKQMWFEFVEVGSSSVLFHFGMTVSFAIKGQKIALYKSFKVDDTQWPPRFTKILIEFSNGEQLAFCDPRRLGRIKLRSDPLNTSPLKDLGIDPVTEDILDCAALTLKMASISVPIKTLLLDQERLFCGIGNYLADEILYQARIHPASKACDLKESHVAALVTAMNYVLKTAVDACADYSEFPADWLFHRRWDLAKSKSEKVLLPNGNKVLFEVVAGRTTAFVPSEQKIIRAEQKTRRADTASDSSTIEVTIKKERKKSAKVEVDEPQSGKKRMNPESSVSKGRRK